MFASYLVLDSVKLPFSVNNKSNKPSRLAVALSRRGIGGRLGKLLGRWENYSEVSSPLTLNSHIFLVQNLQTSNTSCCSFK